MMILTLALTALVSPAHAQEVDEDPGNSFEKPLFAIVRVDQTPAPATALEAIFGAGGTEFTGRPDTFPAEDIAVEKGNRTWWPTADWLPAGGAVFLPTDSEWFPGSQWLPTSDWVPASSFTTRPVIIALPGDDTCTTKGCWDSDGSLVKRFSSGEEATLWLYGSVDADVLYELGYDEGEWTGELTGILATPAGSDVSVFLIDSASRVAIAGTRGVVMTVSRPLIAQTQQEALVDTGSLDAAIARASRALVQHQEASGCFDGTTSQGTDATAQAAIALAFLGELRDDDAAAVARFLEAHVRLDGGVPCYPMAETSSLADACLVRAALRCCGLGEREPVMRRLSGYIHANGGPEGCDALDQLFLVLAGELAPSVLAPSTSWHLLAPPLYGWLGRTFLVYYGAMIGILVPVISDVLHRGARPPGPVSRLAHRRLRHWLAERQNPDGNWGGGLWLTVLSLVALHLVGMPHSEPAFQRGLRCLDGWRREHLLDTGKGLEWIPYNADNWNTAVAATALQRAGGQPQALEQARQWLRGQQAHTPAPEDWVNLPPEAPRAGGWSFESTNFLLSDTDTTAMALEALAHTDREEDEGLREAGLAWLRAMQNPDGGFPAFTRGQRAKGPEPLFLSMPRAPRRLRETVSFLRLPPLEFVDCSTADLSGRVLLALGATGARAGEDPAVDRVIAFLEAQRLGATWWCRWTTGYLAAAGFILRGLAAVGCSTQTHPWIGQTLDWLASCQNEDGGFGEKNASYSNPGLAGVGPSNAYLTGLALHALCDHGRGRGLAARRAAAWLVQGQDARGLWPETQALQNLLPPDIFYTNHVNYQTAPLAALAAFREVGP